MKEDILRHIQNHIDKSLLELDEHLILWLKEHIVSPFLVTLIINETSGETETYWQLTNDTGINDSSYQVIYCPTNNAFGITMCDIFLGLYGDLSDTVMNM